MLLTVCWQWVFWTLINSAASAEVSGRDSRCTCITEIAGMGRVTLRFCFHPFMYSGHIYGLFFLIYSFLFQRNIIKILDWSWCGSSCFCLRCDKIPERRKERRALLWLIVQGSLIPPHIIHSVVSLITPHILYTVHSLTSTPILYTVQSH